ncbi:MAG: BatA domain-containing protein [Verrucomicrobia bacterium]|nr:BatA domain-containing protein [Verrucomicrobiota bacterium]
MFLLNPAALFFAALVPVIVALYLLKVRRRSETVSTLLFWRKVALENRRRALWQKLRRPLSLLLQLLLLALVLLALARPEWSIFRGQAAGATVVLLDARARLQAIRPDGRTRFEAAREAAAGWLRRASTRQPVALLVLTGVPRVAAPLAPEGSSALAALEQLTPTDATSPAEPAFALARTLLEASGSSPRLIWISDEPPTLANSPALPVEWIRVGEEADNVGFTRFALRTRPDSPDSAEVFFSLANRGRGAVRGQVELTLDGRLADTVAVALEPGASRNATLALPSLAAQPINARGLLAARWRPDDRRADALPSDDVAYALAPRPRQLRVLLVTAGNAFLERALAADDNLRVEQLQPSAYTPALARAFEVVILDQTTPGAEELAALPPGRFLYLGHSPLGPNGPAFDRPVVGEADTTDPLLRNADLREVNFLRAVRLPGALRPERRAGWRLQAPLRSPDAPLVLTGEREDGSGQRFVATAFGVADSDLPLRVAFPVFLGNALRWLAGETGNGGEALPAGTPLRLSAGETVSREPLREVGGAEPPASPQAGPATVALTRNGFYRRTAADGTETWLAVCTLDEATTDLRQPSASAAAGADRPAPLVVSVAWPPWVWLAVTALALSLGEWLLYHRRRTE